MVNGASNRVVPHWYMYPPKTSFRDCQSMAYDGLGLGNLARFNAYVHVPFCNMKCSFCSLFTSAGHNEQATKKYVDALCKEIDQAFAIIPDAKCDNLYIGGGTPALLNAEDVDPIMLRFNSTVPLGGQTRTVEFSPDVVSETTVATWRRHGFNRVSLGVQSLDASRLISMHRHHDGTVALGAIKSLISGGFEFVNVDLIFGGHGQGPKEWLLDVEQVVASGADSCTFHPMATIEKTAFERKLNSTDAELGDLKEMHAQAIEYFVSAGWSRTSAISFSRTGTPNPIEHSEAYGKETLGFGAGARSYLNSLHISTLPAEKRLPFGQVLSAYYEAVDAGRKPALSTVSLSDEEMVRRSLVLQLHHGLILRETLERLFEIVDGHDEKQTIDALFAKKLALDVGSTIELSHNIGTTVAELGLIFSSPAVRNAISQTGNAPLARRDGGTHAAET